MNVPANRRSRRPRQQLKQLYSLIPFKQQLFTAIRWMPLPWSLKRHLKFSGTITVRIDATHRILMRTGGEFIENRLFWRGYAQGWEATSLRVWGRLVPDAKTIIDVGANSGLYALSALSLNPSAVVVAFEPLERIYRRLSGNIAINRFDIRAVPLAVSDQSGSAVLYDLPRASHQVASLEREESPRQDLIETTVQTTRLDDYCRENALERIDLMKIDIEGHEPAAIRGLGEYLERSTPAFLIEILRDDVGSAVWEMLRPLDYEAYKILEGRGLARVSDLRQKTGSDRNYLLCRHATFVNAGLGDLLVEGSA